MKKLICTLIFILCFSFFTSAQTGNSPCPEITVQGPAGLVKAGETITFTAKLDKKTSDSNLEFEWTVSQGTILDQQGTSEIRVATTEDMAATNVTATVKIKGLSHCNNEASEIAVIQDIMTKCVFPYGKMPIQEELLRIDNYLISVFNDPGSKGYIFFEIDKNENLRDVKNRITKVFKHIFEKRKVSRSLIFYDVCYSIDTQTTFNIIPAGTNLPSVPNCEKVNIDLK
jgi:hypothetical protein